LGDVGKLIMACAEAREVEVETGACTEYGEAVDPLVASSTEIFVGENDSDDCPVSLE
jgi:hypothetical protein